MSDVPNVKSTGSFCREEELEVVLDNRSEKLSEYKKRYGARLILLFYFTPYYMARCLISSLHRRVLDLEDSLEEKDDKVLELQKRLVYLIG